MSNEYHYHPAPIAADAVSPVTVHELRHRFANELAATLASLHIAKARGENDALITEAIDRVEAQAELARYLVEPKDWNFDLVGGVAKIGSLLITSRRSGPGTTIHLKAMPTVVHGNMATDLLVVMNELLVNALKHVGDETISIVIDTHEDRLRFRVSNAFAKRECSHAAVGQGMKIIGRYVRSRGGVLRAFQTDRSFSVVVDWPLTGN